MTTVESFYLKHNIPVQEHRVSLQLDDDGNPIYAQISSGFHDSMGVSMEDEFDLEDDPMTPVVQNMHIMETMNVLSNKSFDIEINESLTISAKFLKENNILEISEKSDVDIGDVAMSTATDFSYDDENEVIGYGKWIRNGKMSFKNVKYVDQKLLLSFDGCCDGKKVLGRLRIYHDNGPNGSPSPKPKKQRSSGLGVGGHHGLSDENDLDDDEDELLFHSRVHMVDTDRDSEDDDDEEEEQEDEDDRISFIQMIIVSNIYDS